MFNFTATKLGKSNVSAVNGNAYVFFLRKPI